MSVTVPDLIEAVATFSAALALGALARWISRRAGPGHPDDAWGNDQW